MRKAPFENMQFVPLERKKELPNISGIYFAVQNEEVLYVGQSRDIGQRWKHHHKIPELIILENVLIYYTESDGRSLFEQEAEWVREFNPPLNTSGIRQASVTYPLPEIPATLFWVYNLWALVGMAIMAWDLVAKHAFSFAGALIFMSAAVFMLGGLFSWWLAKRVYKARTKYEN